ncbi:MAG TPA: antitoxin VapB family protein [Candidatus Nanoarchaeia archaeon]|nr:antitoxin VapB family protein [Candidatus Nanoarchaeia archaeon]
MAVKTVTITEDAYGVLKSWKQPGESFSETLLRVGKKRSLRDFFGILSKEAGDEMEQIIKERRKRHTEEHEKRVAKIVEAFNEMKHGDS